MATSMPLPFKPQIPATPPPDQQAFGKGPLSPPEMPNKPASPGTYNNNNNNPSNPPHMQNGQHPQMRPAPGFMPGFMPGGPDFSKMADLAGDPRYLAMASRIASYYQQRCQAVANYQQQRCQAWANMHRQKCQEMMQSAMLIVAWYIRDRISRRRRRQKRQFKRRLSERSNRSRIAKGETVRRWVMDVPLGAKTPSSVHDKIVDEEEATFSMDKESNPDKDTQLFNMADNLIKSQLARIDVPLLGALSFDESDSESDDDDDMRDYEDDEEEEDYEEDEDYEQPDENRDVDNADQQGYGQDDKNVGDEPGMGSEEVQLGTGHGSQKPTESSVLS
ncbi:hypothetical protein QBC37DRAFT_105712 [Rhypophila decipiens]|uniref:Uncharacterized protein n=1 Tax=Rhypophila decipiens TaxID=261697 RepID=A0AAN6YDD5_9PEZI|nr:hypothetical protein QBC37DRAFT_105712 [Rhypophila decipiens]